MTQTIERQLTIAEFAQLPDCPGQKMELVNGRVIIMAPVGPEHGREAARIIRFLDTFADEQGIGDVRAESGYRMPVSDATVRAPDVSFVTTERQALEQLIEGFADGIPDLAVEVVSPSDRAGDLALKVHEYLASGVPRVWVVDPGTRTVTVHRPGGDSHTYGPGDRLTSADAGFAVDGFDLEVAAIFRGSTHGAPGEPLRGPDAG